MPSLTKAQRAQLRQLAVDAHSRELTAALTDLYEEFGRWGGSETGAFDLNEIVHKFHDGISRELYKRYVLGSVELGVIYALQQGILGADEVDEGLIAALGMPSGVNAGG